MDFSGRNKPFIEVDRISDLPDSVICHILSFIDTKLSVQTCVLSKRWKSLWTYVPFLRYDLRITPPTIYFESGLYPSIYFQTIIPTQQAHEKLVTMSLFMNRCQSLDSFSLTCLEEADRINLFPAWLTYVMTRNVRSLELNIGSSNKLKALITLPTCIFNVKSLEILKLHGDLLVRIPGLVSLPRLECLSLKGVKYGCGESVRKLIGGCPVLKSLYIERKNRYDNIVVFTVSSETLEHLEILAGGFASFQEDINLKLEINAPFLKYLRLCDYVSTDISFSKLPLLDELHLFDCNNPVIDNQDFIHLGQFDFTQDHLDEFGVLDFYDPNLLNDPDKWVLDLVDEKLGEDLKILTIGNEDILSIVAKSMKVFSTVTNLILTSLWQWTSLLAVMDKTDNLKVLHLKAICQHFSEKCEEEVAPGCLVSSLQRISIMSWLEPYDDGCGFEYMVAISKYFLKHGEILQRLDLTDTFEVEDSDLDLQRMVLELSRKSSACEVHIVNEFPGGRRILLDPVKAS